MSRPFEEIEAEALELDSHARAALAKRLLDSLEEMSDSEYDAYWKEEVERRCDDYLAGRIQAVDGEEVFARLRARKR